MLALAASLTLASPATAVDPPAKTAKKALTKQQKDHQTRLAAGIQKLLSDPAVARSFWGIKAVTLEGGQVLYESNADKLFTPASNTKLFTTAATLALIGPDYRFRTTVETTAQLDKYGRINGDIALIGRGDPNLSGRVLPYVYPRAQRTLPPEWVLQDLAAQLIANGVKFVDGNIVGDDSYFAFERYGQGWSQEDVFWDYGAPVSALSLNDNVIFVTVQPGARPGDRAFIQVEPFAAYLQIDNRATTTPSGSGPAKIGLDRQPGSNVLTIWGNIPADGAGTTYSLAITDPAEFAAQVFRSILLQRGVVVYGGVRTRHADAPTLFSQAVPVVAAGGGDASITTVPLQPLVLAGHESRPLHEALRVINKESQNLHAEIMLRLLGRERGSGGTIEGGSEVLKGFLGSAGILPEEYVLLDGSGLSRQNLVTPNAMVKLLAYVDTQPWAESFRQTLPVAGTDGTLAIRMRNTVAQGRVFAKTGLLGHVNALSGYATTLSGERVAFSIMTNNHNLGSRAAVQVVDQIVQAIVNDVPPASTRKKK